MCRRETIPANPVFPQRDVNNKWTLALYVLSKRTKHMYVTFIVDGEGLVWVGHARSNSCYQQCRSSTSACGTDSTKWVKFGNNFSRRAAYTLVRGSTNSLNHCSSRIFGWRSLRTPWANSQKHQVLFITRHTPSRLLEWVFNGSHFSCFMFIMTLTHSLVCMMHR